MTNLAVRPPPAWAVVGLLLAGGLLWAWADAGDAGSPRAVVTVGLALAVVATVPALRRPADGASPPSVRATVAVAVLATAYLAGSARWQGRDLGPHAHDEFAFLIQARQLAGGRLWSHLPDDVADLFDSPYLIVRPVYAVQYWPGTAMAYVPGTWLGLPPWWTAVALAGATVAAAYHLARELSATPAAAGVAAALLAAGRPFHTVSVMTNSHVPVLLGGLTAAVAAVRWRRTGRAGWAAAFGAAAGWAAICRPIDAICLVLPVAVATTWGRGGQARRLNGALIAAVAAGPFLALQGVFDRGVTGRWLDPPFAFYYRRDFPLVAYGFPPDRPDARPASVVPQKRDLYEQFARPFVAVHQPGRWVHDWATERVPAAVVGGQPAPLLLVLAPLGAAVLVRRRWGWAVVAPLPLFCVLYAPYTIFLATYAVLCGPAVTACVVAGLTAVAGRWPPAARAAVFAVAVGLAAADLPEVNGGTDDPGRPAGVLAARALDRLIPDPRRAVVFVRYHAGEPVHDEPVYNPGSADPVDGPRIVLAHDLGRDRDAALVRHYAAVQPDREVYLLDRADYRLTDLGPVHP